MRAVDTNLLVRLVAGDDERQTSAAENFVRQGAWVSHLVLAEMTWVLDTVYARTPQQIAGAIEMLLNHEKLSIQDPDAVTVALAIYRARPSLGFSDCLIVEIARKAGHLPLGTFDRDLSKVDGVQKI